MSRHVKGKCGLANNSALLNPALGLNISTKATPNAQETMALYLVEGGDGDRLLGLSYRCALIGPKEANVDCV